MTLSLLIELCRKEFSGQDQKLLYAYVVNKARGKGPRVLSALNLNPGGTTGLSIGEVKC